MQDKFRLIKSGLSLWLVLSVMLMTCMPPSGYAAVTCSDLGAQDGFTCTDRADGIDVVTERDVNLNLGNFDTAGNSFNTFDLGLGNFTANVISENPTLIGGRFEIKNGIMSVFNAAGVHVLSTADFKLENASLMAVAGATNTLTGKIDATGFVLNEGRIHGDGDVALIGKAVENRGTIDLPANRVYLTAGKVMTVGLSGDNLVSVVVDEEVEAGDEVLDFEGNKIKNQIENSGNIKGHKITLDAKGVDSVFEKAINLSGEVKAVDVGTNDKGELVMLSMDDIYNNAILEASKIEINTRGTLTNQGSVRADEFREHAYTFRMGGIMSVGRAYFDNMDGAAFIMQGATLSGVFSDTGDIVVLGDFSLGADTIIWADDDSDGGGAIDWMDSYAVNGNGYNLTLRASQNSRVGDISNVGVLDIQASQPWFDPTFVALPTDSIWTNITDFRLTDAKLNRFAGGGVIGDPYMIHDIYGLQAMNGFGTNLFQLANDIDATSTAGWNDGAGFVPIGSGTSFSGSLDGQDHAIDGLYINLPSAQKVGLFAYLSGATIENLHLTNVNISGGEDTGGLVGSSALSTIQHVAVTGDVKSFDSIFSGKVGGLVGKSEQDMISYSSFTGTVEGFDNVGGLIGDARGGHPNIAWINGTQISNSWAIAAVTGRDQVGGFIGDLQEETQISYSYAQGTVIGNDRSGGFAGRIRDSAVVNSSYTSSDVIGANSVGGFSGTMEDTSGGIYSPGVYDSYATGNVTGFNSVGGFVGTSSTLFGQVINAYYVGQISSASNRGGFVGANSGSGKFQSVYWFDKSASPVTSDIGLQDGALADYDSNEILKIESLPATQQQATFSFDFGSAWAIDAESQTPYLQALSRHPRSNVGTPSPNSNSTFVQDVLSQTNFDRAIIRDIFSQAPDLNLNPVVGGDLSNGLRGFDFVEGFLNGQASGAEGVFGGADNFFGNLFGNEGADRVSQAVGPGLHEFKVDAGMLNLPDAMSLQELNDIVFKAEAKPIENRPETGKTTEVEIADVEGDVRVLAQDGTVYQVEAGQKVSLQEGDQIWTGEGATAKIKDMKTNDSVEVTEGSAVRVDIQVKEDAAIDIPAPTLLQLAMGGLKINSEGGKFSVQQPKGISGQLA